MLSAEVLFFCSVASQPSTIYPPHPHLPCSMRVKFLTERHNIVASRFL